MGPLNEVDKDQPNKRLRLCSINAIANENTNHHVPVRTVYVCVPGANADQVKSRFARFGEIESVSMRFEGGWKRRYLVQFKREEYAAEALQCAENQKYGKTVEPADSLHQPDHPLNNPPDSESNIVCVLNDDCIQEIFRRLKLLEDLTNVAGVCVRFNQQAKVAFASQHLDIGCESLVCHGLLEIAMKHFGKHIRSLSARSRDYKTEASAIDVIGRCCGPELKQLELDGFQFRNGLQALRPIFAGIEQLKLSGCASTIGSSVLMTACAELKSLTISSSYGWCSQDIDVCAMKRTFPKLQEFSLNFVNVEDEIFESFVIRHPALIKLSIGDTSSTSRVLRTIGQHAKGLEELKFVWNRRSDDDNDEQIQNDATCIGQLSSLRELNIDSQSVPFIAMMNALVASAIPIKSLEVSFCSQLIQDDAIKCISRLKQIETLRLTTFRTTQHVTDVNIIGLTKNLPELKELDVKEYSGESQLSTIGLRKMLVHATKLKLLKLRLNGIIHIDIDDYKAMLSVVQKRKEKVPLVIEIHGKADQIDVPAIFLTENCRTFDVKVVQ